MDERVFHYAELVENYAFPFEQKDEVLALFEAVFEGRRQEKPLLVSFIRKETARVWYEFKYKLLPMDGDPQLAVVYLENVTHKIIRKEIFEHEMEFRDSVIGKNLNYIEFELTKKSFCAILRISWRISAIQKTIPWMSFSPKSETRLSIPKIN